MAIILDGKKAKAYYAEKLKEKLVKTTYLPHLVIIQIGDREESNAYIKQKIKFGESLGIKVGHIRFGDESTEKKIINKIKELNKDISVNGIIVQLPIPSHFEKMRIINQIDPKKDTDGLTDINRNKRSGGLWAPVPATARGVFELLNFYNIEVSNKKIAVLGRSILAGGPIAEIMEKAGAKVTVCNSKTPIDEEKIITRGSDITIIAIGKPEFLNEDFLSHNKQQVVVDVGINPVNNNDKTIQVSTKLLEEVPMTKFVGDVDYRNVINFVSAISRVPGGVGQMTVLALFENLIDCIENNQ